MAFMPRAANVLQWSRQTEARPRGGAKSDKVGPSSDWSLQLDSMKSESLVIVYQRDTVNVFLSLVHTARQVMEAGSARSRHNSVLPKVSSVTGTRS